MPEPALRDARTAEVLIERVLLGHTVVAVCYDCH